MARNGELDVAIRGEYQAPGWDKPCPRLNPNGLSVCEHTADKHDYDFVCSECASSQAAFARPCAKPIREEWRKLPEPILQLLDREVRLAFYERSQMACGRLLHADNKTVELAPIERPMRFAINGGTFSRPDVQDISLILDSWR